MNACNSSSSSGGPGPTVTHTATKNCHRDQYCTGNPDGNYHRDQYRTRDPDCDSDCQWSLHVRNAARTRCDQQQQSTRLGIWWGRGASRRLYGERHADLPDGQFQR
jgi:hypothetical protein